MPLISYTITKYNMIIPIPSMLPERNTDKIINMALFVRVGREKGMPMTPRENILRLLRREGFSVVPVLFSLCPSLRASYPAACGTDAEYADYFDFPWRDVEGPRLPPAAPIDWQARYFTETFRPGTTWSAWGVGHEPGSAAAMHMKRMLHPMERFTSLEEFQSYPYPDYAHADTSHLAGQVRALHARGLAATGQMACTVWETAWYMRGMEQLMMDMQDDEELAAYHLDRVTELACLRVAAFARAGVDHLHLGDDIGMQQTIMMSEGMYREWIKPRLRRVVAAARAEKPDLLISYHSCGFVTPFIPDLIEVGVDVLNPVQPECMDFAEIHAAYGDRLSFWGTLGTQTVLPFGAPAEVRAAVRRNLDIAGAKGGLLCTPSHLLEPEVPWENILAYVEACRDYTR